MAAVDCQEPDFSEDSEILANLTDPADVEAFSNLMENAHQRGQSAASFVREEPARTSRRAIRDLCTKDKGKTISDRLKSVLRSLWRQGDAHGI